MSSRQYRLKNQDRCRAESRAYHAAHREEIAIRKRARYAEDPERHRAASQAWREAHPEQVRAYGKGWAQRNPGAQREWARRNRDKRLATELAWNRRNPEKRRAMTAARRARKSGNGGSHTVAEWLDKVALFAGSCVYCGEAKPLERDHNIPLSRGGNDDISNILPACKSCNSRKRTRTALEYISARKVA